MDYQIKPSPKITSGAERVKAIRLQKDKKESGELKEKKEYHARQEALTQEIIESSKDIADSIESSAAATSVALQAINNQIAQIKLDIPTSEDGEKVSGAISQSTAKIEVSINELIKTVSDISLETQTIDLNPHTEAITKAISVNIESLKGSIKELTNSVKAIEFEHPPLVMLSYKVTRISDKSSPFFGYVDELHPIMPEAE